VGAVPKEVYSREEFLALAEKASECRVKRLKDMVKLKLRTKRYLYTYKASPEEAEELIKSLKIPVREV